MKPKWMKIFDDILPALIGVIMISEVANPPIIKMPLVLGGIALILNTVTKILERLGGTDD